MDRNYLKKLGWKAYKLVRPIKVYYADGRTSAEGMITHVCLMRLTMAGIQHSMQVYVTSLGKHAFYLGYNWLYKTNPAVDWINGKIKFPDE